MFMNTRESNLDTDSRDIARQKIQIILADYHQLDEIAEEGSILAEVVAIVPETIEGFDLDKSFEVCNLFDDYLPKGELFFTEQEKERLQENIRRIRRFKIPDQKTGQIIEDRIPTVEDIVLHTKVTLARVYLLGLKSHIGEFLGGVQGLVSNYRGEILMEMQKIVDQYEV